MFLNSPSVLWRWPMMLAEAQVSLFEILVSTPAVVKARLPMTTGATGTPEKQVPELARMVVENTDALTQSTRLVASTIKHLQIVGEANARDFGKLTGRGILWPSDYVRMAERNLNAFAAMMALPGQAIAPIHERVMSNAQRLKT